MYLRFLAHQELTQFSWFLNFAGICTFVLDLNSSEFSWTTSKDAVVFIKVNCISTEFTQKKHGGEKGAGFRLQVDAFKEDQTLNTIGYNSTACLQASSCQIRVFKVQ